MVLDAIQYLILGIVQGILEWLPVSSSGFTVLIMSNFFGITDVGILIQAALFLHLGTFLAAAVYFHHDVRELIETAFRYKKMHDHELVVFNFILVSTIVTAFIGLLILITITIFESFELTGKAISFAVGFLLLLTGIVQLKNYPHEKTKGKHLRHEDDLQNRDSFIVGIAQGFSTLPGLSRSGITTATLMLRKFDDTTALKMSFLMSLPVVLFGNLILNYNQIISIFSSTALFGLLASFAFGLITIHILMKLSKKINFGWFLILFALGMMISVLI